MRILRDTLSPWLVLLLLISNLAYACPLHSELVSIDSQGSHDRQVSHGAHKDHTDHQQQPTSECDHSANANDCSHVTMTAANYYPAVTAATDYQSEDPEFMVLIASLHPPTEEVAPPSRIPFTNQLPIETPVRLHDRLIE